VLAKQIITTLTSLDMNRLSMGVLGKYDNW